MQYRKLSRRAFVSMAGEIAGVLGVSRGLCKRLLTAAPIVALLPGQDLKAKVSGNTRLANVGNKLVYRTKTQTMIVEPWGKDGLRVRAAPAEVHDTAWSLVEPVEATARIEIDENKATIRNGIISARIQDDPEATPPWVQGLLRFYRQTPNGEECILSEYDYETRARVDCPGTRILRETENGLYHAEVHFEPSVGERFYGLGQNATGRLDLKGLVIDLYQCHVKAVVPFLVSNRGYGFLWNNPGLGRVDLGYDRTRWTACGCRQIDYYVCAGSSYAELMERYAEATGHPPMLPYWASGFWQCKLRYETQAELLGVAREYKRRDLPLSVIVIDYLHWKKFGDWQLDPAFWPDPKGMVRELEAMGARVMVSPWILVSPESENYPEMERQGMFITSDRGAEIDIFAGQGLPYTAHLAHYDPTNPQAAQFLWSRWKAHYFDNGIRTFWLDPCDTVYPINDYESLRYHIGRGVEVHNYFPIAHQKVIHDGLTAVGENEVVMICRSVWAGSQRYGAALWSGDILSSFEVMSDYMKAGLNVAMSGIPWWTTDIGGFMGGDITSPLFRELIVRWYQYGVFCPLFRTHGARPGNEAWSFGEEAYRHIRRAMLLRERLRPYVMEQMKAAHERGLPPMRPIFFDFREDKSAAAIEDEFLFGPDLLIAPILNYQARSREVYLPDEVQWRDAWTGKRVTAGRPFTADAPLEHIPVYVREGNEHLTELFRGLGADSGRARTRYSS